MIAEWDTKKTYIDRVRGRRRVRSIHKKFRGMKYKRGIVWRMKDNPVRQLRNLERFLKRR